MISICGISVSFSPIVQLCAAARLMGTNDAG
jgi:hypothetical protein